MREAEENIKFKMEIDVLVPIPRGASLKDLGKKMFAFSKLELPAHTIIDVL